MGKPEESPVDEADLQRLLAMADLGVMTASLLHELRQPLFAIRGEAQLGLVRGGEEGAEALRAILAHVEHVSSLVDFYGSLGREEEEAVFDLNQPVQAAVDLLVHRQRRSGALLELELTDQALWVRGRELAARQVAVNLLQNAFDAVEEVSGRRVAVRTALQGSRVRLEVEDSGPGVPDELRTRVFEPFVSSKPPGRGTGLGLYITQRLVADWQGRLVLSGGRTGGTRAVVELPRAA